MVLYVCLLIVMQNFVGKMQCIQKMYRRGETLPTVICVDVKVSFNANVGVYHSDEKHLTQLTLNQGCKIQSIL